MTAIPSDRLQRFLFESFPVRGKLVHLHAAWRAVLDRHDYPAPIRELLGQALAASVLLASTVKFDGRLTLQIQGEGAISLLLAQCTSEMKLRGLARWREVDGGSGFAQLLRNGRMLITIESEQDARRYQGIVPLEGATLAACIENYFMTSEQLATRIQLCADAEVAAGMLLQRMPGGTAGHREDDDDWTRVQLLAHSLTDAELRTLPDEEVLHRLFHEDDVRVFRLREVGFHCSCDRDRVAQALIVLGRDDLESLLEERGGIDVACEFCNQKYNFDHVDTAALFVGTDGADASSTQLH